MGGQNRWKRAVRTGKKKIVPECAGVQPCNMLYVPRELTLQEVQPLECRLVDRYKCRQ